MPRHNGQSKSGGGALRGICLLLACHFLSNSSCCHVDRLVIPSSTGREAEISAACCYHNARHAYYDTIYIIKTKTGFSFSLL